MPETITHQIRTKAAQRVARHYATRWWWVDVHEIEQEAYCLALEAEATLREPPRNPIGFLLRAITRPLVVWLWKQSKSISVTRYATQNRKLEHFVAFEVESFVDEAHPHDRRIEWVVAVQQRIRALLDARDGDALQLLTGDVRARELAQESDLAVREVYNLARRVRRRLEADAELHQLWLAA
jgi:DNA-directed RNA polymerase specialized sigma24 family protein